MGENASKSGAFSLKRYADPARFHAHITAHLIRHEAENNLVFGILANVLAGDYSEIAPYMAVVERDGDIAQVLLRTPPHPLLISYRESAPPAEMVRLVVEDLLREYGDGLSGMTADKQVVNAYADAWKNATQKERRRKMAMRIYSLVQVRSVTGIPGKMRPITEKDRDLAIAWNRAFNREIHHENLENDRAQETVDRYLRAQHAQRGLMFWEVEGTPVSIAGYSGPTPHGIRIGAVYTPPEHRKRGYASACVSALSQHLLDRGFDFCFLFTDLSNPTSNHIYQEIGYRPVSDVDMYAFG